jgi:hypothetical protein
MTFKNDHKTYLSLKTPNGQGEPCPYKFLYLHGSKNKNAKVAKNLLRTQREKLCVISANFASLRLSYCSYNPKSQIKNRIDH